MTIGQLDETDAAGADRRFLHTLFFGYALLIPIATLFFRYGTLASGLTMTIDRALFWTLNSLTCTGFRASVHGLEDMTTAGHIGTLVLMLCGAFFSMSAGGLLVCRILDLNHSRRKIVTATVVFLTLTSLAGAGLLMTPGRSLLAAVFESASSITNTGMSLEGARELFDPRLFVAILPLAAVGALGMPVIVELAEWFACSRKPSDYSRLVLRLSAGVWLLGFAILLLCGLSLSLRENVAASWIGAVNTRSLAADVYYPVSLPRATWWAMTLLMLAGAAPGSPTGGLRLTTLWTLWTGSRRLLRGEPPGRSLGAAMAYTGIFLSLVIALFFCLLSLEPQLPADRLATLAAGALTNTGLSHDPLSNTGISLYVLSLAMGIGHILPVAFAWWMHDKSCYNPCQR